MTRAENWTMMKAQNVRIAGGAADAAEKREARYPFYLIRIIPAEGGRI